MITRRWAVLHLPLLLLLGCPTTPVTPPGETVTPLPERRFDLLGTAKKNIAAASPDTLKSAILLLSESADGESETGRELLFLAAALMERVYPLAVENDDLYPAPVRSPYVPLLEVVDRGEIPEIAQENVSFLTTLLIPLALLKTEEAAVTDACREVLERLIDLNQESILPVYLHGFLAEREGDGDMALDFYRRAFEMDPSCYPAEIGIARIYIANGRPQEGFRLLERQLLRHPGEESLLKPLAEGYYQTGEYEKALKLVASPLLDNPEDVDYLLLKARALERIGRYEAAGKLFVVVEKKLPRHPGVIILKARLLAISGDISGALDILIEGRQAHPENLEIENSYGELLLQSNRTEEGRDILYRQLEKEPESVNSLRLLLQDAMKRKEWDAAEEYVERMLNIKKTKQGLTLAFEIAQSLGKVRKATALITDLVDSYPEDDQVLLRYGEFLIAQKNAAARGWLISALKGPRSPSTKSAFYFLISLTYSDEKSRIAFLRSSLLEDLENVPSLLALSQIYISRREYRSAQAYLKQAERFAPDNADIRRALEEVEGKL